MSFSSWRTLIDRFSRMKALVIGDLMLDHYIWGRVSRISPEAPVPIVEVSRETDMPGGAGNVALNLADLGAEVHVVGAIGQDAAADRLLSIFSRKQMQIGGILRTGDRPTILKTRIIAHHQQVVRVDREIRGDLSGLLQDQIEDFVVKALANVQAVIFSDYGKGVVTKKLIAAIIPEARRRGIPITVDPKIENFGSYKKVTCVTPNLMEAMEGVGIRRLNSETEIEQLGKKILSSLQSDSVLITRGEKGMSLFEKGKAPLHIPTSAREVYDVTGAGDTVISALTLALAAGAPLRTAAELANHAAGIVVGKLGTATVTGRELLEHLRKTS
jgi:D-glycero-beta-D-manno-heptose-7-phosphate kinase